MTRAIRILGAGGHAKVAAEAWQSGGGTVAALYDDDPERLGHSVLGLSIAGTVGAGIEREDPLHIAIGDNEARRRISTDISDERFPPVIHAAAFVSPTARIGAGALVCAGAIIQAETVIGRHAIVNSGAIVEHDTIIGDHAHVAPGVRLGGGVKVGAGALIGIGATVLPGVEVGERAIVGAGAVVLRNVEAEAKMVGNPGRQIQ